MDRVAAEILRGFRRNILFMGTGFWLAEGCALAAGAWPVPGDLAGIAAGMAFSVLAYPSVREGTLRRITSRPRMTPEDYRQLRVMELELGFEPSDVPSSGERAEAKVNAAGRAAREESALRQSLAEEPALPPLDRAWTMDEYRAYESVCRRSDPDADYLAEALSSGCLANLTGSIPPVPRCECAPGTFSPVQVFTADRADPVFSYCSGCHRKREP